MSALAEQLRERNRKIIQDLTVEERLDLAFELGEHDLETYRASNGLTRAEALAHFRRQKQQGRQPCRCLLEVNP
ncbi:MAG: hypothetical protein GY906_20950 [bacterium]|nr:hypothetical protein [bacterium]